MSLVLLQGKVKPLEVFGVRHSNRVFSALFVFIYIFKISFKTFYNMVLTIPLESF